MTGRTKRIWMASRQEAQKRRTRREGERAREGSSEHNTTCRTTETTATGGKSWSRAWRHAITSISWESEVG